MNDIYDIEPQASSGSRNFLLVEDSKSMRAMLRVALHEYDPSIQITEAVDGNEALQELRLKAFDAVFLDIALPGMHGLDVLSRIRKNWQDTPVIMCTGKSDVKVVIMALGKGANGYIVKPVNQIKVERALEAVTATNICPLCGHDQFNRDEFNTD
jgi:two-component system chemotaxis response regulator CheY